MSKHCEFCVHENEAACIADNCNCKKCKCTKKSKEAKNKKK